MTARDTQRSKVYAAEEIVRRIYDRVDGTGYRTLELHGSQITLPVERRFASIDSIRQYLDLVRALTWVRAEWPRASVPVAVRKRAGQLRAHYDWLTATIAIPPHERNHAWAMREFVVLHEFAHHLDPNPTAASHGPEFVDRFARLVNELIGPEAELLLRSTMYSEGVSTSVTPAAQT